MPATRKSRKTSSRVDILAKDLRNLSTTDTTTTTTTTSSIETAKTENSTPDLKPSETRIIATRAAVKTGKQVLVETTNTENLPTRRRRRCKKTDSTKNDIKSKAVVSKPTDTNDLPDSRKSQILASIEVKGPDDSIKPPMNPKIIPDTSSKAQIIPPSTLVTEKTPTTVRTSFLLVSDTHDVQPQSPERKEVLFRYPFPKTDVFIHAGDMTQDSNLFTLKAAISWIELIPAELKILIAGNHDTTLDVVRDHVDDSSDSDDGENKLNTKQVECREYLTSKEIKAKGIFYLENEVETFKLKNGAMLTVFGSPYTPRGPRPHHNGAFRYNSDIDFWEKLEGVDGLKAGKLDVAVIHGPAYEILDSTWKGKNVGCKYLRSFLEKVKPLMSVCGHIHEAAGVKTLEWDSKEAKDVETQRADKDGAVFTDAREVAKSVARGKSTVFVNASLVGAGSSSYAEAARCPYVVELDLPLAAV
ncbi:hypothetical protein AOL_s00076g554 [Orbilia oligospora ATCC 24927]|uniref:Calcineurin-like phosphoesterase domain-containing protein n=1 Tax=Arthrobotrys oligospora (strain ATCC 24927 / CBS 115.81 / DSM 1491) TaxID=756982 RepID=G1XA96_ARTOA|nr:hypothetical protein AOL_s00076g554 [Orbilia oligospora ATCC 24927]EGX49913.1 hypothetical protein AOL_s00076g554 [Orbilia oligospora ATCC 24927]